MDKKIVNAFYNYIDKARINFPEMKDPSGIFLYQDQNESTKAEAFAFAYCNEESFMQTLGNFFIQNPQFIQPGMDAINGAMQFHNQKKMDDENDNS